MKTKLLVFLCLGMISTGYACGGCDSDDECGDTSVSACSCVDPTCSDPYSCMTPGACCSAFGNIAAMDSSPDLSSDVEYSYSSTNLFSDYSYQSGVMPVPAQNYQPVYRYRSYKGE